MSQISGPVGSNGHRQSGVAKTGGRRRVSGPLLVSAAAIAAFLALIAGLAFRQIAAHEDLVGQVTQLYVVDVESRAVSPFLPDEAHWYVGPAWSPDGKHLAYSLALPGATSAELMIANADGTAARPLTNNGRLNYLPSWSPDSTRIAYVSQNGSDVSSAELYVINADGTGDTRLTSNDAPAYGASWSPDGKRIVFGSDQSGAWRLYIMGADGSSPLQLLAAGDGNAPAWSPNGKLIAFVSARTGHDEIYVFDINARRVGQLTPDDSQDANNPVWSPDGGKIAFSWNRDGKSDVFVMNADGSDPVNLTASTDVVAASPSWSSDGKRIVFYGSLLYPGRVKPIEEARLATVVLYAALFTVLALFLIRRRSLPFGALTALAAISGAVLAYVVGAPAVVEVPGTVAVVAAAGLAADLFLWRLRPMASRWRLLAAGLLIPLVVFGLPLAVVAMQQSADYPSPLAATMAGAAAIAGLVVSLPFGLVRWRESA